MVEEIASEQATVVIGTVIDPTLEDEIKVTVVATGIDGGSAAEETVKVVSQNRKPDGSLDLKQLEMPAVLRRKGEDLRAENNLEAAELSAPAVSKESDGETDSEYLDIPTFLRRQAD